MTKRYAPDYVLLSPRVRPLINDAAAQFFLEHLEQLVAQPFKEVPTDRGPIKTWGVEVADEDDEGRIYRVLCAIEEEAAADGATYLILLALEEHAVLNQPARVLAAHPDWSRIEA